MSCGNATVINACHVVSKCSLCEDQQSELYFCESCDCDKTDSSSIVVNTRLCDVCIGSHLKRGHSVKNTQGQEPLFCKEHKLLQREYCRTCDVEFCSRCLKDHSEHKFGHSDNRSSDLKASILDVLGKLEPEEKILQKMREDLVTKIEQLKCEQKELRELFLHEMDNLKKAGVQIIDDNCALFDQDKLNITACLENLVKLQGKLRDLLSVSNHYYAKDYPVSLLQEDVEKQFKEVERLRNQKFEASSCDLLKLKYNFAQFGNLLQSDMTLQTKTDRMTYFICSDEFDNLFRLSFDCDTLKCERVFIEDCQNLSNNCEKEVYFKRRIAQCFPVHQEGEKLRILLLSQDKMAYIFSPLEDSISLKQVEYPTYKHFLRPYSSEDWDQLEPEWCYWDEETKLIKFTHDEQFTVKCDELPSVRMASYDWDMICFITRDSNIIAVDIRDGVVSVVSFSCINHISSVSSYCGTLLVWSAEDESVLTSHVVDGNYTNPVKHMLDRKALVTCVFVNEMQYSLLPCLRNSSGKIEANLFMIKR